MVLKWVLVDVVITVEKAYFAILGVILWFLDYWSAQQSVEVKWSTVYIILIHHPTYDDLGPLLINNRAQILEGHGAQVPHQILSMKLSLLINHL